MCRNILTAIKGAIIFIVIFVKITAVLSETVENVDNVVDLCMEYSNKLLQLDDEFTRKTERSIGEPDLFFPQIESKKFEVYDKEVRQRPFECIYNYLNDVDNDTLSKSKNYQDLKSNCEAGQSEPKCDPDYPYRTFDGTCNNLYNPKWGSSLDCARRLLPPYYEGAFDFRKSACDGKQELPNPRNISVDYMTSLSKALPLTSSTFMYFGQFLSHDLGDTPVTFVQDKHLQCCKYNLCKKVQHPQCKPITISQDDYIYGGRTDCFNFIRAAPCDTCSVGKRIHMNEVTDWIDLSHVYGLSDDESEKLRRLDGSGKMIVQETEAGDLLPPDKNIPVFRCGKLAELETQNSFESGVDCRKVEGLTDFPEDFDMVTSKPEENYTETDHCFKSGDRRVNQHTVLMSYHTVFLREHNRIADTLKSLNPMWDEEKLFQEARKINIAQFQVVVYSEFLGLLLKEKNMALYDLHVKVGPRTTYDPTVDATLVSEFSTAAYRLHSMINSKVGCYGVEGPDSSFLRNLFSESSHLYNGKMDELFDQLINFSYNFYDTHVVEDLSHFLYKEPNGDLGFDLSAVNIQRGRDNGLPPYVDVLKYYSGGKIDIKDFDDLTPYIDKENIQKLKLIYCDVRDIDLWIGLNSELPLMKKKPLPLLGKTAVKIVAEQFQKLRFGDRFFFDNDQNWFTEDQIEELKKASFSRILCDNTNFVHIPPTFGQPKLFNPLLPCELLLSVDLTKWKEF